MYRWLIFSVFGLAYIFSYFIRFSTGVLGPELMKDLGIGAGQLGIMAGILFYAYAIVQIPLGLALDSYSAKRIIISATLLAALGCFLFSLAKSFEMALIGRVLIGFGMSPIFMGGLKIFNNWFRSDEFGLLSGSMISLGNFGGLLAAAPLVFLASTIGWRKCFLIFAIFVIFITLLIFWIVKDFPPERQCHDTILSEKRNNISKTILFPLVLVFSNKHFWLIAISTLIRYGSIISIQGFLGTLYLIDVLGYDVQKSGNILSMISVGYLIGSPMAGRISDVVFRSRKKVVLACLSLFPVLILPFLLKEIKNDICWYIVFLGLGLVSSAGGVSFAHVKELFPREIAGFALSTFNLFAMGGVGIGQHVLGIIIGRFPKTVSGYPLEAYHQVFITLFVASIAAFIIYLMVKDTNPLHYDKTFS